MRLRGLLLGTLILVCQSQSPAQDQPHGGGFQLLPGVVVSPDRRVAYIMNATGGIDAVELTEGKQVWSTRQAAKPLGLAGDVLISQSEPSDISNELQIVALDRARGREVVRGVRRLPADVRVSIDERLSGSFLARASSSENDAVVSWEHSIREIGGVPPDETGVPPADDGELALRARVLAAPSGGTLRMNLSTGEVSEIDREPRGLEAMAAAANYLPNIAGPQLLSADGRHVLSSRREGDSRVWKKYRLTIHDRGSGRRVGEFKSHVALVSFSVVDSRVIYETGPYRRRTTEGFVEEPLKIRAEDLRTGTELWSREVRDTTFRGALPP